MLSSKTATWIEFSSIVRRELSTASSPRNARLRHHQLLQAPHYQSITSTCALQKARRIHRNHFTSSNVTWQDDSNKPTSKLVAIKKHVTESIKGTQTKPPAAKRAPTNSLRKVAFEAQRNRRALIRGRGRTKYVDPEADTKEVTAYCAAEKYSLSTARYELEREGYVSDPFHTGLGEQVIHVQTPNYVLKDEETGKEKPQGIGDVFIFPSGCVVFWNVPDNLARTFVTRFLPSAAGQTREKVEYEMENLEYIEDPTKDQSQIIGDTIILGTKPLPEYNNSQPDAESSNTPTSPREIFEDRSPEIDTTLAKIAFSSGLARSTKLAVLEETLNTYFANTQSIPKTLASGKHLAINRSQILQRTGELLQIRAQLNLYSELTDSLPDLFWDSPHVLGLEGYYEKVGKALDVGVRIKVLNERMDHASEIASVLRERLSEKHSTMLEWMIIGLICIEVGFGVVHLWRESDALAEKEDEKRTRELFEVWLEGELRKKSN